MKVSQTEAHATLVARFRALKATSERTLVEKEALEATVRELRPFKKRADDLQATAARLESERKVVDRQLLESRQETAEISVALRKEQAERKASEEEVVKLKERLSRLEALQGDMEVRDFHIPLKNNQMWGDPSVTTSLDQTEVCFLDPDRGVGCLHMHLAIRGRLEKLQLRRSKRKRLD